MNTESLGTFPVLHTTHPHESLEAQRFCGYPLGQSERATQTELIRPQYPTQGIKDQVQSSR